MDIVYSCDETFAPMCATSIISLLENNKSSKKIRIFVLGNKLSKETSLKLRGMLNGFSGSVASVDAYGEIVGKDQREHIPNIEEKPQNRIRSLKVIGMENFEESLKALSGVDEKKERFPLTALCRIFAPRFLPEDVNKFLYLDSDTIVRGDIEGLFKIGLKGFVAGMIAEPTIYKEVRKYLNLKKDEPYYNSGVMLIDRFLWEKEDITNKCVELLRKKQGSFKFTDQDLLNKILKGRILTLPQTYDFFSNYHYRSYKSLINFAPWYASCSTLAQYESARANPMIVHFAGDERPWNNGNFNPYKADYEKYLDFSPWAGKKKIRGHEKEMFFYHLMNLMTGIFPSVRDKVSAFYYRKNIK